MKRLVTLLLSVLLALVMCFSVIACGDKTDNKNTDSNSPGVNDPNDDPDGDTPLISPEVADKAARAIRKLYETDSYVASGELGLDSKQYEAKSYGFSLEKRGSKLAVSVTGSTSTYIIDTDTGYAYIGDEQSGYIAMPALPQNLVGYYTYVFEQSAADYAPAEGGTGSEDGAGTATPAPVLPDLLDVTADYDEATETLSVSVDAAEYVNDMLAPLYDAYKKNKTLKVMLDDYVRKETNNAYSFTVLYDTLFTLAKAQSNTTLDRVNAMLKSVSPELDIYEILGEFTEVTPELRATVANRTIGEMISGVYDYITTLIAAPPTSAAELQNIARNLALAAFVNETEASLEKIDQIKAATDLILGRSVKVMLDGALANSPEALAILSSGVTFKTLKYDTVLKFDADGNIETLTVSGELEHSYVGDAQGFVFLSDNEYKFDLSIGVSEYSNVHTDFAGDITPAPGAVRIALVYGDITADVSVFVEMNGETLPTVAAVNYYYADEGVLHAAQTSAVSVNGDTSSVVVGAAFVNEVIQGAPDECAIISVELSDGTRVEIAYVGVEQAEDVAVKTIGNIMRYIVVSPN